RDRNVTGVQTCALPILAGSMTASGIEGSSLATAFRRNLLKGDPQELSLAVHQLSFADALPVPTREASLNQAQGVVLSYANTRRRSEERRVGKEGRSRRW